MDKQNENRKVKQNHECQGHGSERYESPRVHRLCDLKKIEGDYVGRYDGTPKGYTYS